MIIARVVAVAASAASIRSAASISLQGIKNFRRLRGAASSLPVYRCAALDGATPADVIALASIDGKRLGRVIDLRNDDEIGKGRANRTAAATDFYRSIAAEELLINRPLLGDITGFWGAVADQAPPLPVFPKIAMLWSSRPLDEALSRALEDGGLAMLYTCILASAPQEVGRAVDDVIACAVDKGEAVVFHCAKLCGNQPWESHAIERDIFRSCVCAMAWRFHAIDATLSPWPRRLDGVEAHIT